MTIEEALTYINSKSWSQWKLGLSRTIDLLKRVGDPHKDLKFVHIAGTNGKGSTSAMITSILTASGYRVGMYPSPFIETFNERIQINGEMISDDDLCELTEIVKAAGDAMEDHPTHFEIITAIGMLYFKRKRCDVVVLEVGLGGTFDSTNVIDSPELCVITNIGFDHTQYLGETLAEIASNKAGIIKKGSDVVCYPNVPEVMAVIEEAADKNGSGLEIADFSRISVIDAGLDGQTLSWSLERSPQNGVQPQEELQHAQAIGTNDAGNNIIIKMPLIGRYQVRNAAVALTAAEKLARQGWNITPESIRTGMAKVSWPARFELLGRDPVFILDGGHNKQCAEAVAESLKEYLPGEKLTFLIGMLGDKDYEAVLDVLLPFAAKCFCVTPDSERALPAQKLADSIEAKAESLSGRNNSNIKLKKSKDCASDACEWPVPDSSPRLKAQDANDNAGDIEVIVYDSVEEAVSDCTKGSTPVLAFGSLYLAGEVRKAYRKCAKKGV